MSLFCGCIKPSSHVTDGTKGGGRRKDISKNRNEMDLLRNQRQMSFDNDMDPDQSVMNTTYDEGFSNSSSRAYPQLTQSQRSTQSQSHLQKPDNSWVIVSSSKESKMFIGRRK